MNDMFYDNFVSEGIIQFEKNINQILANRKRKERKMNKIATKTIAFLRRNSKIAYIASINDDEYPVMRAMLVLESESLKTQYFSTNTSSNKVFFF